MTPARGGAPAIVGGPTNRAPGGLGEFKRWEIAVAVSVALLVQVGAGIGLQITHHEEGIGVRRVVPGGPAEEAGLLAGDVVLSVNGVDTTELSVQEFVEVATGPIGSRVQLLFLRQTGDDWQERQVTLTRRLLAPQARW